MDKGNSASRPRLRDLNAEMNAFAHELRRLSNEVRTKATYRPVECERRYLYDTAKLQEHRMDTGEMEE